MTTINTGDIVPGTDVTIGELIGLGHQTLGAAAVMLSLGHVSIGGLTSYVEFPDDRMSQVLKGIVYSALVEPSHKNEDLAKMEGILWDCGWMHRVADLAASQETPRQTLARNP